MAVLASCASLEQGAPTYENPVLEREFADPAVLRAPDGWFYVYATQGSAGGRTFNIQTARSADLVHWEILGDALPEKPRWAATKQKFWAPHVLHDPEQGKFFLYYSAEPDGAEGKCLAVAISAAPAGPFVDSGRPMLCGAGIENIDPMAFDDPRTGKRLLYWGSGSSPIRVQELAADRLGFLPGSAAKEILFPDASRPYGSLVEGAWVTLHGGFYYLFYSGERCCGPEASYAVMAARSQDAFGPFEPFSDPVKPASSAILERSDAWRAPGHNSVVTDDAGEHWMVYHAMRAAEPRDGQPATARLMLIDRITWRDGWPRISGNRPSALAQRAPQSRARPRDLLQPSRTPENAQP